MPQNAGTDEKRIKELIEELGDPSFTKRENAAAELKKVGEKALPAVVAASNSDDPEVRARAADLVRVMMLAVANSKSTDLKMVPIRVKEFEMGSPNGETGRRNNETSHTVQLTKSFLIGTHEVKQSEFAKVMKRNPSWFSATGGGKAKVEKLNTDNFPVEQVTWFDAIEFCNKLSKLDGFEPYYKLADEERNKDDALVSATVTIAGGNGYRLPTEAEWEYACRGGTTTAFNFGARANGRESNYKTIIFGGYGGSEEIFLGRTTATGSYAANRFGLFDMHGNVAEWCWDWYEADYYENAPKANPTGPKTGTHRVLRSGSWLLNNTSCRSAARGFQPPKELSYTNGFRVARSPY
jgi:formylglycine-generating enzyme required for sulfatase activity